VPRVRRDYTTKAWAIPAWGWLQFYRRLLPPRAAALIREGRCEAKEKPLWRV